VDGVVGGLTAGQERRRAAGSAAPPDPDEEVPMRRALVAGHVCVDLAPRLATLPRSIPGMLEQVGPLAVLPGGSVANTGGTLAALGTPVQVVADAGDDELGRTLLGLLAARGVGTERIRLVPGRSTSYTIVVQPDGRDRSFWHHVGANAGFDGAAVDLTGADLLHVGYPSLLPALVADDGAGLHDLLARARAAGLTTSLDLAVLEPDAPGDWPALLRRVVPLVDVLTPSVDDVAPILGTAPGDLQVARQLVDLGAAVVMVTGGPAGARLCTAGAERLATAGAALAGVDRERWSGVDRSAAAPDVPVRNTVGTGDAATAGLLHGLLTGLDPDPSLDLAMRTAGRILAGLPARCCRPADGDPPDPAATADRCRAS
jgi:sugar/nucleoside kinase (ribokinase family)